MRTKSVWLHSPFGDPKKRLFSVSENEISLGDSVLATTEVIECKRRYPNAFLKVFRAPYGFARPRKFACLGRAYLWCG